MISERMDGEGGVEPSKKLYGKNYREHEKPRSLNP
jgi:hypothetical protein